MAIEGAEVRGVSMVAGRGGSALGGGQIVDVDSVGE